jgi:hypothetical protein
MVLLNNSANSDESAQLLLRAHRKTSCALLDLNTKFWNQPSHA